MVNYPHVANNRGPLQRRQLLNKFMLGLIAFTLLPAVIVLIWVLIYVAIQGFKFISLDFFLQLPTPVGVPGGGIANALVGSALLVGVASIMAIPIGLLAGVYSATHPATAFGNALRFATDTLSGVPSIVMGIFAYSIIVVPTKQFSAFSGSFALMIIMLPIIIRTTEEMIKLVPAHLREASLALGAPEWRTTLEIVLPAALNGVVTGIMLAIARVMGEAAPLILTAFGNPFMNTRLDQPISSLPHTIYVYAISPYKDWQEKAWSTALVLIVMVMLLSILARLATRWQQLRSGAI